MISSIYHAMIKLQILLTGNEIRPRARNQFLFQGTSLVIFDSSIIYV